MARARIRHIAINVEDRDKGAIYYKEHFGMEETGRGANGTVYLTDGFICLALVNIQDMPMGINHFGFHVDSVDSILESAQTTASPNVYSAVAESWIRDNQGNRIDLSEEGWPV